jgi:hypothetical protein
MLEVQDRNRVAMSQRERDVLKAMQPVLEGKRTQAQAARLLGLSVRQVRRIQRKLEAGGDTKLVHALRGKPSNHRHESAFKKKVIRAYRKKYPDFGPTFACEKLAQEGLEVGVETLRRWLLEEGLWQRRRTRDPHRSRRPRRDCFGELIQMDASIHDWLEGRGQTIVLITMIDDATSRVLGRFYPHGSVEAHMDLLARWLRKHGRPLALYTDRHSIFEPHEKGQPLADPDATTQFGRALEELDIELIRAHSPQAKGRVERSFGTAQDRWVKELRLAKACTCEQANAVLEKLLPTHNKRFGKPAGSAKDAHRSLGPSLRLESILSIQSVRVVSNDYVVRLDNRFYQLLPPVYPGLRKGRVVIEERLDGSQAIRFAKHYLKYRELTAAQSSGGSAPEPPEFNAGAADARPASTRRGTAKAPRLAGMQPTAERSGRTPAEPYPLSGTTVDTPKPAKRPAQNHPWRKSYK